ncbi:MAG: hypothetical protein ACOCVL_03085 [Candidatus Sumerlaeota bacterium]
MCDSKITDSPFKTCPNCGKNWADREAFLCDSDLLIIGYQVHFEELELGLFIFDHRACGSSIAIPAGQFTDLYQGKIFKERKTGGATCQGFCLHKEMLGPCPAQCECAYVREIIQLLKKPEAA